MKGRREIYGRILSMVILNTANTASEKFYTKFQEYNI
jgi:hypothetical protein